MGRRRWGIGGPTLPRVGPFESFPEVYASSLPSLRLPDSTFFNLATSSANNPAKYNVVDIGTGSSLIAGNKVLVIWCNIFRIRSNSSFIFVDGDPGDFGLGGTGMCGGGGAGLDSFLFGAAGGAGADSQIVSGQDGENNPGSGGFGFYGSQFFGSFKWPTGGTGGAGETVSNGIQTGSGGSGGGFNEQGFGNGGGGGGAVSGFDGGGGGGGAGLLCIVCNRIERLTAGGATFYAVGGSGFDTFVGEAGAGGGGGGGAVYIAARYHGPNPGNVISPVVFGGSGVYGTSNGENGNSEVYQINADNSLTVRTLSTTWG